MGVFKGPGAKSRRLQYGVGTIATPELIEHISGRSIKTAVATERTPWKGILTAGWRAKKRD
jgi:hypothetical protein